MRIAAAQCLDPVEAPYKDRRQRLSARAYVQQRRLPSSDSLTSDLRI
jgi:hypothetical protein